jgi:opacity protein-like surface antigen
VVRIAAVLLVLLAPAPGAAAPPSGGSLTPATGPGLFAGYSYTRAGEAGLHGWQLDGSYPLGRSLVLVADLSGHYGSFAQADLGQLAFLAGARWVWARGRLTPFVEGLLGGVRTRTSVDLAGRAITDTDTDWGPALGGGMDYRFADRWSARARVDLLVLRAEGSWESDPRLSLGVVYRLGD